jgi:hypothetical protein
LPVLTCPQIAGFQPSTEGIRIDEALELFSVALGEMIDSAVQPLQKCSRFAHPHDPERGHQVFVDRKRLQCIAADVEKIVRVIHLELSDPGLRCRSLAALFDEQPFLFGPLQRLPLLLESAADEQFAVPQDARFAAEAIVQDQFAGVDAIGFLERPQRPTLRLRSVGWSEKWVVGHGSRGLLKLIGDAAHHPGLVR